MEFNNIGPKRQRRLDSVLQRGVSSPLLLLEAPPGYGKTEALEAFFAKRAAQHAWLRLRELDNWEFFFWDHFTTAWATLYPGCEHALAQMGFPDTPWKMSRFLTYLANRAEPGERVVLVADDYSALHNKKMLFFFESLIEANLSNICLAVVSSQDTDLKLLCLRSNVPLTYLGEQSLRLLPQDVSELFSAYGVAVSTPQAQALIKKWNGWPLALFLLAKNDFDPSADSGDSPAFIQQLFDREYYAAYADDAKKTLVQLSLVESFDAGLLDALSDNPGGIIALLDRSPFVYHDIAKNIFQFHPAYKDFLGNRKDELTKQAQRRVYAAAAAMFLENQRPEDAIPLLLRSKQYDKFVDVVWSALGQLTDHSRLEYLSSCAALLPAEYLRRAPKAELQRIALDVLLGKIKESEPALRELLSRFESGELSDTIIMGEAHYLLALILQLRGNKDFVKHYKIASVCEPNGSRYLNKNPAILMNISLFNLPSRRAATLQRMEQAYKKAAPYLSILLPKTFSRIDLRFSMEAAYNTYRLDDARTIALEISYSAEAEQHHELVLLTHCFFARIAMLQGRVQDIEKELAFTNDYIELFGLHEFEPLPSRLAALLAIYLDKTDQISKWLAENNAAQHPLWDISHNAMTRACCLLGLNQFAEASSLLDHLESQAEENGFWGSLFELKLRRAVANLRLGNTESAMRDLVETYEMTYANGIITPFIECAGGMRALLDAARTQLPGAFDPGWFTNVYAKASSYAKKILTLRKQQRRAAAPVRMSPRRLEILQELSQGLTADEIAEQCDIAVSTVKTHIQNIYNDLGAINRADAVRIASAKGLI